MFLTAKSLDRSNEVNMNYLRKEDNVRPAIFCPSFIWLPIVCLSRRGGPNKIILRALKRFQRADNFGLSEFRVHRLERRQAKKYSRLKNCGRRGPATSLSHALRNEVNAVRGSLSANKVRLFAINCKQYCFSQQHL